MVKTLTKYFSRIGLAATAVVMVAAGTVFLAPAAPAEAGYTCTRPTLREGSRSACVRHLQAMLNNMYPFNYSSEPLSEDGIFGPRTHAAVREYQRVEQDLTVDGIVGPNTWWRLCHKNEAGFYHKVLSWQYARWHNAKVNIC